MNTGGERAFREDEPEDAVQRLNKATKSGAAMVTIDFSKPHASVLEHASNHEDMTWELEGIPLNATAHCGVRGNAWVPPPGEREVASGRRRCPTP